MRYHVTIEFETDYEGEITFSDVQNLFDEGLLDDAKVVNLTPIRKKLRRNHNENTRGDREGGGGR
jgi:hypothetical protein